MRTFAAEGVRFEISDCDCGKVCTDEEAVVHLKRWDRILNPCAFCGEMIRPVFMKINHVHKSEIDEEEWGVTNTFEMEEHFDWSSNGPYGWFDIKAHSACAKKGMPYANFEKIEYDRPGVVPEGGMPRCHPIKCKTCGVIPTPDDIRKVAGLVYSFMGPCVYCNQAIKLNTLEMFHGSLAGKHLGRWHFKDYCREGSLNWWGYRADNNERLEFNGHLYCAVKAMRYLKWAELEYVLDYWSKEIPFGGNLEAIREAKKELLPELANKQIRRHISKVVAKEVQGTVRVGVEHIDQMVRKELYDLKEGPREWVPGLKK
jgi:hypothetical protein